MGNIFFISDLHLGHKKILEFSPSRGGKNIDEHNQWIVDQWNSVVKNGDLVWLLGDVAFSEEPLKLLAKMNGHKNLVRGNHDKLNTQTYLKYFNHVYGLVKKYDLWLSHSPIHEGSLRNKANIHGHVHSNSVMKDGVLDNRYFNVSVEALDGKPIGLGEIKKRLGS